MAATLIEGREYGLASDVSARDNKTVILFKLTDSAYRALEEYSKFKSGCTRRPSIQFTDNNGVMCIPGQASSDNPKAERSFKLNLAKVLGDANGSLDCIQQTNTREGSSLQLAGSMQFKVSTHANNDVYTDTRKKFAIADNQSKQFCAKEIKMSSRMKGKTIKKVIPSGQLANLLPNRGISARPSASTSQSSLLSSRLTPAPSSGHSPHSPAASLISSNGVLKIGGHAGSKPSSGAINMPYRERVIQLLALRSYKKPELLARLMKDGILKKDKNSLNAILKSVATMNKDLSFSLAKHSWQEVKSDWPYYTDADRQLLLKNQQQQKDSTRLSVSPSGSPTVSHADSPSPPQKRGREEFADQVPPKRQRISHQQKQQALTSSKVTNNDPTNSTHYKASVTMASDAAADKDTNISESPSSNRENQHRANNDSSSDFFAQYPAIVSCPQRRQYKEDFDVDYAEYQRLYKKIKNVSRRFQRLRERILNTEKDTPAFEELYNEVVEEYERHKSDTQFLRDKERLSYLHRKLGHIKSMVAEYDRTGHAPECR